MADTIFGKLFEHNNWANLRIIEACLALSDAQLDAEPQSATKGTIRVTLTHLVASQRGYLSLLTLPVKARIHALLPFSDLTEAARISGEALVALAKDEPSKLAKDQLQTTDGYFVEPWVVMLQAINHATEHREQIGSMLTALGANVPDMDGWTYGDATGALVPIST